MLAKRRHSKLTEEAIALPTVISARREVRNMFLSEAQMDFDAKRSIGNMVDLNTCRLAHGDFNR